MKRYFALVLCLATLLSVSVRAAEKPDTSDARAAILYEASTDTVLYENNADEEIIPASMTKLMTAILTVEHNPTLSGMVTATKEAFDATPTISETLFLREGETIGVYDCVSFMLTSSVNDAAATLACYVGGDIETFVGMMNEKAAELGCQHTQFKDPHGLSTYGHYTTARDMLKIIQCAMQYDILREILSAETEVLPPSNVRNNGMVYKSTNHIKFPANDPMWENAHSEYIIGAKSGSLYGVGNSFACYTMENGMELFTVVCQAGDTYVDDTEYSNSLLLTVDLLDYAAHYAVTSVPFSEAVAEVPVKGENGESVKIHAEEPCGFIYDSGEKAGTISCEYPDSLEMPVKKGQVVGKATVERNGETKTVNLVAADSITEEGVKQNVGIQKNVLIYAAAIAVCILAIVFVLAKKKKKQLISGNEEE